MKSSSNETKDIIEISLWMKKIIANVPLCVLLCTATVYKDQTNITGEIVTYLLGYIQCR